MKEKPMEPTAGTLKAISILEGIRKDVLARVGGLSEEEALRVPEGHRNCVHWHIGHMLHVQLAHWYVRRGLPLPVDPGFRKYFADGRSPADYDADVPTFARLLGIYREYSFDLVRKYGGFLEEPMVKPFDYVNNHFATVADDLFLLIYHEGEHGPLVTRLLRALGKA
jgi:hypothetical protein